MKNLILIFATMFATFSFAQFEQGTMTFGAGQMFTTTAGFEEMAFDGPSADVSYFVMDGIMVSLSLSGNTEVTETINGEDFTIIESAMNWALGARYYITDDGLFAGLKATKATWLEWDDADGDGYGDEVEETGMDLALNVGLSKALGFDGKLWFEPSFNINMPAGMDGLITYGFGANFRFAF